MSERPTPAGDELALLTVAEAAKRLGVRWVNVRELVETGQLRAVKIGTRYRIPASALLELGGSTRVSIPGAAWAPSGRTGTTNRPLREINWTRGDGGR